MPRIKATHSKGYGLLSVLILLVLLGFVSTATLLLTHRIAKIIQSDLSAGRELSAIQARIPELVTLAENSLEHKQRLLCPPLLRATAPQRITLPLCMLFSLSSPELLNAQRIDGTLLSPSTLFPIFDFDSLLASPATCSGTPFQGTRLPISRHSITPASVRATTTCTAPSNITSDFTVVANLANSAALSNKASLVAAAGFVELAGGIILNTDTLIVAGGDLVITEAKATAKVRLTAVSATGRVKISACSPQIQLKVIARLGANYPEDAATQTAPLLPPLRRSVILGIR